MRSAASHARVTLSLAGLLAGAAVAADTEWGAYNHTLSGERFSELLEINTHNATGLRVACRYDTGQKLSFQSGLVMAEGRLYGTTQSDTFALDPATCRELWRVHEEYKSASPLKVNRGVAYLEGRLFRGTQDGRVLAYRAASGERLWQTRIGNPQKGETVPAAPMAWNGRVFVGNAGGDLKGNKGRMYALDAATGKVLWEQYLVPRDTGEAAQKDWQNPPDVPVTGGATWTTYTLDAARGTLYVPTGNAAPDFEQRLRPGADRYTGSVVALDAASGALQTVYPITPGDFHDWDVSSAPALITTQGKRQLLIDAPKDGRLHAFDLGGKQLYATPVSRIENDAQPFAEKPVHFCPGTQGGSEWNGPAFNPQQNLVFTGSIEWCTTVKLAPLELTRKIPDGGPWTGNDVANPKKIYGTQDPTEQWAGWVYAVDADSGAVRWKYRTPYPVMSGITATAGGVVFAGDMGGTLYAFESGTGQLLWSQDLGGALGGGIITYKAGGAQRLAVAVGMTSPIWPTQETTGQVVVLAVEQPHIAQRTP